MGGSSRKMRGFGGFFIWILMVTKLVMVVATVLVSHGDSDSGGVIELGCNCKGDLGAAHKQCAETWFKFRSNFIAVIIKRGLQIVEVNPQVM
uniref:RINGv domain-containing protein n=1 Tax=Tanacetum cinerariifolium TaxID=118510 RepID=A0A6L2JX60_TANCI|nr:RINGv domain-containing protein [Tanacetum cinerariifolium]